MSRFHSGTAGRRVLAAGFLAAVLSAPGQTFFVTLYVPEIAGALALSPVTISTLYGIATLLGAALLPLLGIWADRWPASRFLGLVVGIALGYATGASAVAGGALLPAYFGLAIVGRIRALTGGIRNAATAGAPLLVAFVVERTGLAAAAMVLAAIGIVALVLALLLPPPAGPNAHVASGFPPRTGTRERQGSR